MSLFDQLNIQSNEIESCETSRPGITLAKVTNINDPDKLGRVKCAFVSANKEARELDWAYVMTPFGGKQCGFYFMPNVGDVVLVAFESGDVCRPYIIGSVWGNLVEAPQKLKDGVNETYMIKTPNKSMIELMDKKGEEVITIKTPKERKVVLDDKQKKIIMTDGDNSVTLNGENGEVAIKCKSKLTIQVGGNATISIDGTTGAVKIEGKQSVDISGTQINIKAKASATVKGDAQVTVESGGMTTVKGGMLKLN